MTTLTAGPAPATLSTASAPQVLERTQVSRQWCTVVHDDPVNTMTYVVWVLRSYFSLTRPVARARMMEVHTRGRAVVSRGSRERMEVDVAAMHSYGLRATIEPLGDSADGGASGGPGGGASGGPGSWGR